MSIFFLVDDWGSPLGSSSLTPPSDNDADADLDQGELRCHLPVDFACRILEVFPFLAVKRVVHDSPFWFGICKSQSPCSDSDSVALLLGLAPDHEGDGGVDGEDHSGDDRVGRAGVLHSLHDALLHGWGSFVVGFIIVRVNFANRHRSRRRCA